jgi:Asp-tRNA(Asn)/Glu-tRNA(Gln) amidotransferase A subunit family amidase
MTEYHELSLSELAAQLHARKESPVAVTEAMLKRIEALDGRLHAFVHVMHEVALAQAREAEAELARGHLARLEFSGALARAFDEVDLFLSPTWKWTSRTLSEIDQALGSDVSDLIAFTAPYDASGSPTLSLPAGFDERGAPLGFQLVGRHLAEPELLRAGHVYQQHTDWHRRTPAELVEGRG